MFALLAALFECFLFGECAYRRRHAGSGSGPGEQPSSGGGGDGAATDGSLVPSHGPGREGAGPPPGRPPTIDTPLAPRPFAPRPNPGSPALCFEWTFWDCGDGDEGEGGRGGTALDPDHCYGFSAGCDSTLLQEDPRCPGRGFNGVTGSPPVRRAWMSNCETEDFRERLQLVALTGTVTGLAQYGAEAWAAWRAVVVSSTIRLLGVVSFGVSTYATLLDLSYATANCDAMGVVQFSLTGVSSQIGDRCAVFLGFGIDVPGIDVPWW